jgi:hypothetical protein
MTDLKRGSRYYGVVLAVLAALALLGVAVFGLWGDWQNAPLKYLWAYLLASVPALLIVLQGVHILTLRERIDGDQGEGPASSNDSHSPPAPAPSSNMPPSEVTLAKSDRKK